MECENCLFAVSLHRVVEVREGQLTEKFDKFPYEQVKNQSFSLIYQQEGARLEFPLQLFISFNWLTLISDKRYAYLTSLDLICDHPLNYELWINEVTFVW